MKRILAAWWNRQALNQLSSAEYGKAEESFRKVRKYGGLTESGFLHNMGLIAMATKRYDEAERDFLDAVERFGETAVRARALGDLYFIWGKREQAQSWYRRTLALSDDAMERRLLEMRLEKCGSEQSYAPVRAAHERFDEGLGLMKEKKYPEALAAFSRSVELDDSHFHAMNNLGSILLNVNGDAEAALVWFERAGALSGLPIITHNLQATRKILEDRTKKPDRKKR